MPRAPGTRLGHYEVTAVIGEGGMGQVWQATDTPLAWEVALKILPEAFATGRDHLARFERQATSPGTIAQSERSRSSHQLRTYA